MSPVSAAHARLLEAARLERRTIGQNDRPWTSLTIEEGYAIQAGGMALRLAEGGTLSGWKMGFTSLAKMRQMGLDAPISGYLMHDMAREEGLLDVTEWVQPKVEPEIVFRLRHDPGPSPDFQEAVSAIAAVGLGLEVLDSRFEGYRFTLPEVLADNTSAAAYVLGSRWVAPDEINLSHLGVLLTLDGQVIETASSAAVMDHPVRALMALARLLHRRGQNLAAGQLVLTGGVTAAHPLTPGRTVLAEAAGLGRVGVVTRHAQEREP